MPRASTPSAARRVLFVEDEPGLQRAYRRFFGGRLTMSFAGSGAEARTQLAAFRPQVVVLDLQLPDTDGVDLLQELRRSHPDLPVVITTAYSSTQPMIEVLGLQHSGFLLKPFDLAELERCIRDA